MEGKGCEGTSPPAVDPGFGMKWSHVKAGGGQGAVRFGGDLAVGENQWYHFGVGAPPILVDFSGDWDVHWGYELLTHAIWLLRRWSR